MKRVFIGILYCGENDFKKCLASLSAQVGVEIDKEVIAFLPKKEAHRALYDTFNKISNDFDFFAKLDADMVFARADALSSLIGSFEEGVDMLSVTVWDKLTDSDMQSFNIWRGGTLFAGENDDLFTDKIKKVIKGKHLSLVDTERRVLHGHYLDAYQAFMFGAHRATKVLQVKSPVPRIENSYHQWRHLSLVYLNWQRNGTEAANAALLGAIAVFDRKIKGYIEQKDSYKKELEKLCGEQWEHRYSYYFSKGVWRSLIRILGPRRFLFGFIDYLFRRLRLR